MKMHPLRGGAMSRDFVARDPRTGRPIFAGRGDSSRKKVKVETGPYQALPPQVVIPLATGEIESYRVAFMEQDHTLGRLDGIRALSNLSGALAHQGHSILVDSLISDKVEVRIAALTALPSMAESCPDELFDHLSVLLDDKVLSVRKAASKCLTNVAPVFPSATEGTLAFEIRHENSHRRDAALKGLKGLCQSWPEVACDHIDELLQEDNLPLRRAAAGMLRGVLHRGGAAAWDLVGWALEDEDVETRRKASTCLVTLANKEPRIATILAEKAILDPDSTVMLSAIKCIEALDTDHGRARELVINGCSHHNPNVRLACVRILPRLMGDEILRNHCDALMRDEKDPRVLAELKQLAFDAQMEGTEAQKNTYLAPAPSVPQIDREVAESQGQTVGLEDLPPPGAKGEDIRHG
ncbi:MAG TPA: hypothetical protein EYQ73_05080 [Candidatus Poseidoniales archaeon]|nr:hypothetical protein [Candidatus Poseidoniales archaeon]